MNPLRKLHTKLENNTSYGEKLILLVALLILGSIWLCYIIPPK